MNAVLIAVQDHTATSIFVGRTKGVEFHSLEAPADSTAWL